VLRHVRNSQYYYYYY